MLVYSVQTGVQKIGNIIRYLSALPPKPIVHVHLEIIEFVRGSFTLFDFLEIKALFSLKLKRQRQYDHNFIIKVSIRLTFIF